MTFDSHRWLCGVRYHRRSILWTLPPFPTYKRLRTRPGGSPGPVAIASWSHLWSVCPAQRVHKSLPRLPEIRSAERTCLDGAPVAGCSFSICLLSACKHSCLRHSRIGSAHSSAAICELQEKADEWPQPRDCSTAKRIRHLIAAALPAVTDSCSVQNALSFGSDVSAFKSVTLRYEVFRVFVRAWTWLTHLTSFCLNALTFIWSDNNALLFFRFKSWCFVCFYRLTLSFITDFPLKISLLFFVHRDFHAGSFFGHRPKCFWNDRKILSHFGQNICKYRLTNTVLVSFNTTVRQMTEMSQQKNDRNVPANKKTASTCRLDWKATSRLLFIPLLPCLQFKEQTLNCDVATSLTRVCRVRNSRAAGHPLLRLTLGDLLCTGRSAIVCTVSVLHSL